MIPVDQVRNLRGLRLSYFYADLKDGNGDQEIAKISRNQPGGRIESACIPRLHMWRITDSEWQVQMVPRMCEQLYGMVTKSGCQNISHVLEECVEDLHRYPPATPVTKQELLEEAAQQGAIISVNGDKLNG